MFFPTTSLLVLWATLGSAASIPYTHSSQVRRQASEIYFPVENATFKNARVGEYYQASVGGLTLGSRNETANFEKVGGEEWAQISAEGLISGTPATGSQGSTELDLRATADDGSTATLRITIPVRGAGEVLLERLAVDAVDVVGIATDYCVRASALDAAATGRPVRVLTDLVAGVAPASSAAALEELAAAGVELVPSAPPPTSVVQEKPGRRAPEQAEPTGSPALRRDPSA